MLVEDCCQHLMRSLLPQMDPTCSGMAFDIGVGTFSFYCETFAKLGFRTVAVEPLPVPEVRKLCAKHGIQLIEAAISATSGTVTMYVGTFDGVENPNLNSLRPDWWGNSAQTREVSSITLPQLMEQANAQTVTCMKLDVEGSEAAILAQLPTLPESQLPQMVMFEYGGGGNLMSQQAGWAPEYLQATLNCLQSLRQAGFRYAVVIDSYAEPRFIELQVVEIAAERFFEPISNYGNILVFRAFEPDFNQILTISQQYLTERSPTFLDKVARRIRHPFG